VSLRSHSCSHPDLFADSVASYRNGRWRSVWTAKISGSKVTLNGHIQVNVHYYEDGNVQLNTEFKKSVPAEGGVRVRAMLLLRLSRWLAGSLFTHSFARSLSLTQLGYNRPRSVRTSSRPSSAPRPTSRTRSTTATPPWVTQPSRRCAECCPSPAKRSTGARSTTTASVARPGDKRRAEWECVPLSPCSMPSSCVRPLRRLAA